MPNVISKESAASLIQSINQRIRQTYIYPEMAEDICSNLLRHLEDGVYEGIDEGDFLAYALTTHLQEFNHDQHLWVRWHADPLPDFTGPLYQDPSWTEQDRKASQEGNFGFTKSDVLPGNIAYLEIRKLPRLKWGREAAVEALNTAENSAALIFDLCRCEGGFADMVAFITSHLFPEKPLHLFSIYWRDEDRVQEF
jgi:hypothetical protein